MHLHPNPNQLTWNCPGCRDRVHQDQRRTEIVNLTDQDLHELVMGVDHIPHSWERQVAVVELERRYALLENRQGALLL